MSVQDSFRTIGAKDSLVDRVAHEIEQLITTGSLDEGTKLPPERELAEKFGVSRTVTREAVQSLVTKGLLETKHGVGTVVRPMDHRHIVESLDLLLRTRGVTFADLDQVRIILEVEIAKLSAVLATDADITDMRRIIAQMENAAGDPEEFGDLDGEFHRAIADATHNPLLVILLDSIRDVMGYARLTIAKFPDVFVTIMPDHQAILQHILDRDPEGTRLAMKEHLEHSRKIRLSLFTEQENGKSQ